MRSTILLCLLAIVVVALVGANKARAPKKRRVVISAFAAGLPEPILQMDQHSMYGRLRAQN